MIDSERSQLLPGSFANESFTPATRRESNVTNKGVLAILAAGTVLVIFLSSQLQNSDTPTGIVGAQDRAWDETFDMWEASVYHHHHARNKADLDGVELLGKSKLKDEELIYFNHTSAFEMLETNGKSTASDFYYYQQGWDAQINQAYCGVATSMAFMNSLRGVIELPQDPIYVPFPYATQKQLILNECVRDTLYDFDKMNGLFFGIGLDMCVQLLNCNLAGQGFEAKAIHVDPDKVSADDVRDAIKGALLDKHSRVGINYDRGGITQGDMGHGHFSPISAYNHEKDAFLVMDVAKYKYAPVWVPTSKLMGGIGTIDNCANFHYATSDSPPTSIDPTNMSFDDIIAAIDCQAAFRGVLIISPTD